MVATFARRTGVALALGVGIVFAGFAPIAATSGSWRVVVNGLDNPRGLNFGPLRQTLHR